MRQLQSYRVDYPCDFGVWRLRRGRSGGHRGAEQLPSERVSILRSRFSPGMRTKNGTQARGFLFSLAQHGAGLTLPVVIVSCINFSYPHNHQAGMNKLSCSLEAFPSPEPSETPFSASESTTASKSPEQRQH
jgi:hypothetical protein